MKKILLTKYGNKNNFQIKDFPSGKIKNDEIRVGIKYIGLSFTDIIIRKGLYKYQKDNYKLPFCMGFEFSGIVEEIGLKITRTKIGDSVCGIHKFGCYSNEIIIRERNIFNIKNVSLRESVSFPINFFTAFFAFHKIVKIKDKANVLIFSAGGGVGGMLIQLSKLYGCNIIGVVGTKGKEKYVKKLGADFVVNYNDKDMWGLIKNHFPDGCDVIFESSGTGIKDSYENLSNNGKLIMYGFHSVLQKKSNNYLKIIFNYFKIPKFHPFDLVYNNKTVSGFNLIKLNENDEIFTDLMEELSNHLEFNKLEVPQIREFDFADIEKAHELLESGKSFGKIILKV